MNDKIGRDPAPLLYEHPITVRPEDIDRRGHVNNIVYLRWVQDAAAAHWSACATEEQKQALVWVVVRHEIDYIKPAFLGDLLVARTHVGEVSGARFERHVEILRLSRFEPIARARSVWAALDSQTNRPRRVTEELKNRFYAAVDEHSQN